MSRWDGVGIACGGLIGMGIGLGMDLLLGESAGSSWREAVARDLSALLNAQITADSTLAAAGAGLAILSIAVIGAGAGLVFVRIVRRFFRILLSE
ncbi:MAG TPA: hypothetical protein VLH56_12340 [Dissulfurispiraceae bacterium]|nr:hypothetical protein [Dissulfurispiraceae bacterium]